MDKEKAKQAQSILNKIAHLKEQIKWLQDEDRILSFGWKSDIMGGSRQLADPYPDLHDALDNHLRMIIMELKDKVDEFYKQLEDL